MYTEAECMDIFDCWIYIVKNMNLSFMTRTSRICVIYMPPESLMRRDYQAVLEHIGNRLFMPLHHANVCTTYSLDLHQLMIQAN